jgi:hypothetical protein
MMSEMSKLRILLSLIALGLLLDGLLAGSTVDRAVAGWPAWRHLGVVAWAEYSRHADLGYGLVLYPVLAIGGCLFALAVVVVFWRSGKRPPAAALPIYLGAALAIGGLLTTIGAAPNMLSLKHIGDNAPALTAAFEAFYRWSALRGVLQVLLFPVELWALLAAVSGGENAH